MLKSKPTDAEKKKISDLKADIKKTNKNANKINTKYETMMRNTMNSDLPAYTSDNPPQFEDNINDMITGLGFTNTYMPHTNDSIMFWKGIMNNNTKDELYKYHNSDSTCKGKRSIALPKGCIKLGKDRSMMHANDKNVTILSTPTAVMFDKPNSDDTDGFVGFMSV